MNFDTRVTEAKWVEDVAKCNSTLSRTMPNGDAEEFQDSCNVFLFCAGLLTNLTMLIIEGLERLKGRVLHTANWLQDYTKEKWKGERLLIIGSVASSLQVVPSMQPYVTSMNILIRTVSRLPYRTGKLGNDANSFREYGLPL